jgi:eukaryotic-like serine/threonine-protein kinase
VGCLDENLVLAFVDGSVGELDRGTVEAHLAECSACAALVATAAGGEPGPDASSLFDAAFGKGPPAELNRGATVGRYVILNLVGRGGMGEVYAAYDPQLDRRVALKLLHQTAGRGSSVRIARERLLREAKAIARLSHPNVVVVHDAGAIEDPVQGERVFLAMEFIEGETLASWLAAAPRSWREIRQVFVAAGEGLAAAHAAGLVHRDFKPQNVMVGRDGGVRVMDFGLASDASADDRGAAGVIDLADPRTKPGAQTIALTGTGVLLGTPLYMAPEQFLAKTTDARTDQFSFCVTLYEALYGERPFPSDSLAILVDAVSAGRVRDPVPKMRVPSFLRKLLLRGLAVDPASRHESMPALLSALGDDPLRRRRTVVIGAALGMLAIAGLVGVQRATTRGQRICRGAGDKLAGVWELEEIGPRRSAVHRAFLSTGRAFADDTWGRVSALLDDYTRRWGQMYTDTCEATHVRGDQSAEVMDLRMSCLDTPRNSVRALVDVLSHADPAVLLQAVNAAGALPPLERCADVPALRAVVPPPADSAARTRVAKLEIDLTEAQALIDTGQWPAALRATATLVHEAREVGYEPLLAEALAARAWLENQTGQSSTSTKTFEGAFAAGFAGRRDDIAAASGAALIGVYGYVLDRPEDSRLWERLTQAFLTRLGPGHDRAQAWFFHDRAITRQRQGDYDGALADLESALSFKRRVVPPNIGDIGISLLSIASCRNARNGRGDHEAALVAADQAVDLFRSAYGPQSPQLAHPLGNRGESYELLGRYPEAERDLRETVERSAVWVGADHPWTAYPLTSLGTTLLAEGKLREATSTLERALRIRERSEPNQDLIAETRFALARARWELDQDRPGARALALSARDAYQKLTGHAKEAAEIDAWLTDKSDRRSRGVAVAP